MPELLAFGLFSWHDLLVLLLSQCQRGSWVHALTSLLHLAYASLIVKPQAAATY